VVVYDNLKYNMYEVYINNTAHEEVLIFSGVHGNEPAGVLSSIKLIENISKIDRYKKYNFRIVPVVNPWGYEYSSRYNADGIDINRDFSNEQTLSQEANILIQHYKTIQPKIVIDLHETNYNGENYYFVYNNQMESLMRDFVTSNPSDYKFENNMKYSIYKTENGIIKISEFIVSIVRMADRCALSNFFIQKTKNVVVTESSSKYQMEKRISFHLDSIQHILMNGNN